MNTAQATYRAIVPRWVRSPLWRLRTFGWKTAVLKARVSLGRPIVRARLPAGELFVDLRDIGVGQPLYYGGKFEPSETQFISRHLRSGMTMIDVGANLGYHTAHAARLVGPGGRVLAIEPDPYNFALLKRNIAWNKLDQVTPLNVALGAKGGAANLYCSRENLGDHRLFSGPGDGRKSVQVPVVRLDDLCEEHGLAGVDLVKMDVQGYEPYVLQGMQQTLAANPRLVVVAEFWPLGMEAAGSSVEEFFAAFEPHGFAAHLLEEGAIGERVNLRQALAALPPLDTKHPDHCGLTLVLARDEVLRR
jgi:FkbM family methyltransferase